MDRKKKCLLTRDTVLKLIPQRSPMVMVDTLLEYDANYARSSFEIQDDNLFLQEQELQESGLLEHMAQSVAIHTGYGYFLKGEQAPMGYIGAIQKAEILCLPRLGDVVETDVHIIQEFMGVTLVNIETTLRGDLLATAQMKTVIAPSP